MLAPASGFMLQLNVPLRDLKSGHTNTRFELLLLFTVIIIVLMIITIIVAHCHSPR